MQTSSAAAETVVLVHGTFAGADSDEGAGWWQSGGRLRGELSDATGEVGLTFTTFHWGVGANSERARRAAGLDLLQLLRAAEGRGERYHLVGHSHGGSVIWHALSAAAHRGLRLEALATVTTVGTPFLRYRVRAGMAWMVVPLMVSVACIALLFPALRAAVTQRHELLYDQRYGALAYMSLAAIALGAIAAVSAIACARALRQGQRLRNRERAVGDAFRAYGGRWLGIWSADDEAINGLSSTRLLDGRLTPRLATPGSSLFRRLLGGLYDRTVARFADGFVWERLARSMQGLDLAPLELAAVSTSPVAGVRGCPSLAPELEEEVRDAAMTHAARTLARIRSRLGWARDEEARFDDLLSGFDGELSWASLVHNSYFDHTAVVRMIASHIRRSVAQTLDELPDDGVARPPRRLPRRSSMAAAALVLTLAAGFVFAGARSGGQAVLYEYVPKAIVEDVIDRAPVARARSSDEAETWVVTLLEARRTEPASAAFKALHKRRRLELLAKAVPPLVEARRFEAAKQLVADVGGGRWAPCIALATIAEGERTAGLETAAFTADRAMNCGSAGLVDERSMEVLEEGYVGLDTFLGTWSQPEDVARFLDVIATRPPRKRLEAMHTVIDGARTGGTRAALAAATADRILDLCERLPPSQKTGRFDVIPVLNAAKLVEGIDPAGAARLRRRVVAYLAAQPEILDPDETFVKALLGAGLLDEAERAAAEPSDPMLPISPAELASTWMDVAAAALRHGQPSRARRCLKVAIPLKATMMSYEEESLDRRSRLLSSAIGDAESPAAYDGITLPGHYDRNEFLAGRREYGAAWLAFLRGDHAAGCRYVAASPRSLPAFEIACRVFLALTETERRRVRIATDDERFVDGSALPDADGSRVPRYENSLGRLFVAIGRIDEAMAVEEAEGGPRSFSDLAAGLAFAKVHRWNDAVEKAEAFLRRGPLVGNVWAADLEALMDARCFDAAERLAPLTHEQGAIGAFAGKTTSAELRNEGWRIEGRLLRAAKSDPTVSWSIAHVAKGLRDTGQDAEADALAAQLQPELARQLEGRGTVKTQAVISEMYRLNALYAAGVLPVGGAALEPARRCAARRFGDFLAKPAEVSEGHWNSGEHTAFTTAVETTRLFPTRMERWRALDQLIAVADAMTDDDARTDALEDLCSELAKTGRYRRSRELAGQLWTSAGQLGAYAALVRAIEVQESEMTRVRAR